MLPSHIREYRNFVAPVLRYRARLEGHSAQ